MAGLEYAGPRDESYEAAIRHINQQIEEARTEVSLNPATESEGHRQHLLWTLLEERRRIMLRKSEKFADSLLVFEALKEEWTIFKLRMADWKKMSPELRKRIHPPTASAAALSWGLFGLPDEQ